MTKLELLKQCKGNIVVNKEVAKLLPNKTMTRRVVTNQDIVGIDNNGVWFNTRFGVFNNHIYNFIKDNSKHQIGDILWIREPVKVRNFINTNKIYYYFANEKDKELANNSVAIPIKYKNKKPKWLKFEQGVPNGCIKEMTRYFVKITDVRVDRLQDIKLKDICKEFGVDEANYRRCPSGCDSAEFDFKSLWDTTSKAPYKWEDNPYVFVYEWEYIKYS